MDRVNQTSNYLEFLKLGEATQGLDGLQQQVQPSVAAPLSRPVSPKRVKRRRFRRFEFDTQVKRLNRLSLPNLTRSSTGLLALIMLIGWGCWNSKLLLSTVCGIGVMVGIYRMQNRPWQEYWTYVRRWLKETDRQLLVAALSGGIASIGIYMAISIWTTSDNPWIASSLIGENLGILLIVSLMIWQIWNSQSRQGEDYLQQSLTALTQDNPLQRLIAVRQLSRLLIDSPQHRVPSHPQQKSEDSQHQQWMKQELAKGITRSHIIECFRLMLNHETEPTVRDALLDGLQHVDKNF